MDHPDAIAQHTLFKKRPEKMMRQKQFHHRVVAATCRRMSVAGEGMAEFGRYCPSSIAHLVRCHQGTAPHIDLKFDLTTLLGETQFKQDSFAEVLRHLTCEQVQARRVLSCHHITKMEGTINPIRSGRSRYSEVQSHQ